MEKEKYIQLEFNFDTQTEIKGQFCYTKELFSDNVEITQYIGENNHVSIPKKINELNVISIGEEAFKDKQIQSLVLHENIIYIKRGAFQKNKIKEVRIPKNTRVIEENAFKNNPMKNVFICTTKLKYDKNETFPKTTRILLLQKKE